MDYKQLIGKLTGGQLREIAITRNIHCAYLDNGADLDENKTVLLKTILPHLANGENIRKTLAKLSASDFRTLKQILKQGRCGKRDAEKFMPYAFFMTDETGKVYFPDPLSDAVEELDSELESVDERETLSGHIAYAIYISVANGLLMKKIRCLHDMTPGKRMVEFVSEKLNRTIPPDIFLILYNFMLASGILISGQGESRLELPPRLPGRNFFYTNLFKYILAGLPGNLFSELKTGAESSRGHAVMERDRFHFSPGDWELLQFCDFIKALDQHRFIFTDIGIQFLNTKKVEFPSGFREDFFVLPGFRILAQQNISDSVLDMLSRVTSLESFDQVFHFSFTSCSLIQARKHNFSENDLISFVENHSDECPSDLKLMIRDTFERFGEIKILSGFPVLLFRTRHLKEKIAKLDEISRHIFYENEQMITLHGTQKPRDLKRMLVEKGLIPELAVCRDFIPVHRVDFDEIVVYLRKLATRLATENSEDYSKLITLFDKLQLTPDPIPEEGIRESSRLTGGGAARLLPINCEDDIPLEDRVEILQLAIARRYRVKVLYKQKGSEEMEERIISPKFFDGDFLVAFCESRNADRRFNLYRLKLAGIILEG